MIPVLYAEDAIVLQHDTATDTYSYAFPENRGLGSLSEAISCKVTEERNGQYELEMEYPVTGKRFADIAVEALIKASHDDTGDTEFFRIYKVTKPMNGRVTISARHFSYYLSKVTVMPFAGENAAAGPAAAMRKMLAMSIPRTGFTVSCDIDSSASYEVKEPKTFRSILGGSEGSILDTFGGEFEWKRDQVRLWSSRNLGIDSSVVLKYGKNITDLKSTQDTSAVWTGVLPFWKGSYTSTTGRTTDLITHADDAVYTDAVGNYAFKMVIPVDLTSEFDSNERVTKEALIEKAEAYIRANAHQMIPTTIEVSFVPLWQTEEYKSVAALERLKLCDTLTVRHEHLGIDYTAKIIKVEYDVLKERYLSMTIGQAGSNFVESVKGAINEATAEVPTMSAMQMAIAHATELIQGGAGGHMVTGLDEDGHPHELYFMDTDDVNTAMKVLRINMNGIGFSATGFNGPYHSAWTLDGRFVADYICVGSINASLIDVGELNADLITTGALKIVEKDAYGNPVLYNGEERVLLLADADRGIINIVADSFSFKSGDTIQSISQSAAASAISTYDETVQDYLSEFQDQIDGQVEWYFMHGKPTTSSSDASYSSSPNKDWDTTEKKDAHIGDCCYDLDSGKAYKWTKAAYGTWLEFTKESATYNSNDFVKIYYKYSGQSKWVGGWSGSNLSCSKVFVPAGDCYVYWHTNNLNSGAYGFKIKGTRGYGDPDVGVDAIDTDQSDSSLITETNARMPSTSSWDAVVKSGSTLESSHNPYEASLDDFYHWTISSSAVTLAYQWVAIEDESIRKALGEAATAQDTADGKRRNFLVQPTPPYDVGDIWMDGQEIKTCITARGASGSFNASDWVSKNEYTNETYVDNAISSLDTKWSDEDTVFETLFQNGQRGIVFDPSTKKMYISMDLMKGGTVKLGGTSNSYGDGKLGIYDASGHLILWMDKTGFEMYNTSGTKIFGVNPNSNASVQFGLYDSSGRNIIWMDGSGIVVKDTNGNEIMKINPADGFKVGTANGWGQENVQIKDGIITGLMGSTEKSGIDMIAQYDDGKGLILWNYDHGIVVSASTLLLEATGAASLVANNGIALRSNGDGHPIDHYASNHRFYGRLNTPLMQMTETGSNSGSITAYVTTSGFSDRRAKENIVPSQGHMDDLHKLRVVSFDWKEGRHPPGHVSAGLIAQEVQEVLPELVTEDGDGMLGVSFTGLVPFLLEAVQEKDREIRTLQEKATSLEGRLEALEKLVQNLPLKNPEF